MISCLHHPLNAKHMGGETCKCHYKSQLSLVVSAKQGVLVHSAGMTHHEQQSCSSVHRQMITPSPAVLTIPAPPVKLCHLATPQRLQVGTTRERERARIKARQQPVNAKCGEMSRYQSSSTMTSAGGSAAASGEGDPPLLPRDFRAPPLAGSRKKSWSSACFALMRADGSYRSIFFSRSTNWSSQGLTCTMESV